MGWWTDLVGALQLQIPVGPSQVLSARSIGTIQVISARRFRVKNTCLSCMGWAKDRQPHPRHSDPKLCWQDLELDWGRYSLLCKSVLLVLGLVMRLSSLPLPLGYIPAWPVVSTLCGSPGHVLTLAGKLSLADTAIDPAAKNAQSRASWRDDLRH